jgi:hypothetical protein
VVVKLTFLFVIVVASFFSGCSIPEEKPTNFHYLSPDVVQNDMQLMADQLALIALTLLDAQSTDAERRQQILPRLDRIETIATTLEGGDQVVTNYSVINHYMGAFLYDVNVARQFALREPANLIPSGRLVKSCMSCHESI